MTQVLQMRNMRGHGRSHFRIFNIRNSKILAGFFDDLADGRVMHMRDPGKQMMLNLEIQSPTHQEINLLRVAKFAVVLTGVSPTHLPSYPFPH